jgi:hypothetical protein
MYSAEETGAARMAEKDLPTILREIATKAAANKGHRFGGLFHLLDEHCLKECFHELKKKPRMKSAPSRQKEAQPELVDLFGH